MVAVVGLIAGPSAALAQQISPTQDQYDPSSGQIEQQVGAGGNSATPPEGDPPDRVISGLPFTGVDIGLLGGVAVLLGVAGVGLRRFAGGAARS